MYSLGRREDQSPINLLSTSLPTTVSGSQPQNSKPGCVKDQKIKMATPLKIFKTDRFVCTLETLTPVVKTYFPWFSLRIEFFLRQTLNFLPQGKREEERPTPESRGACKEANNKWAIRMQWKKEQDVKGCLRVKLSVKLQLGASSVKGLWAKRLLWFPYQIDYVWIKQIKSKYQRNRFLIRSLKFVSTNQHKCQILHIHNCFISWVEILIKFDVILCHLILSFQVAVCHISTQGGRNSARGERVIQKVSKHQEEHLSLAGQDRHCWRFEDKRKCIENMKTLNWMSNDLKKYFWEHF